MTNQEKVTLYIATHKTGYKYFGKTELYFTQEELQKSYHGSGIGWKEYLLQNGDDVTMEIHGIYNKSDVKEIALKFSRDNNIVESELWANRKEEDGFTGGRHSKESKEKMSEAKKGKPLSEEHKEALKKCERNTRKHLTSGHSKKISESNKGISKGLGVSKSKEHKENISKGRKGIKFTEEHKEKLRRKVECPHCGKIGGISQMKRWHFDNCKKAV